MAKIILKNPDDDLVLLRDGKEYKVIELLNSLLKYYKDEI